MRPTRPAPHRTAPGWLRLLPLFPLTALAGCGELPTAFSREDLAYAKGGPKPDAVLVDSVSPSYGAPGQALTVRVLGSNFEPGSSVSWVRDGVTGEISTVATRYLSGSAVEADIVIAADATLELYDVLVQGKTRSGIGTEKFEVTEYVRSECGGGWVPYADSRVLLDFGNSLAVRSDGLGSYSDGSGGVTAKLAYHDDGCARGGNINLRFANGTTAAPRSLVLVFPPASGLGTVSTTPRLVFWAAMSLGSDVNQDGALTSGYDAHMYEKIQGPYSLEHPALSDGQPGYPNNVADRYFRIESTGISGCGSLEYDRMRITRTSGQAGFVKLPGMLINGLEAGKWSPDVTGSWTAESVATTAGGWPGHWARCITYKGRTEIAGPWLEMPFRVDITEVR